MRDKAIHEHAKDGNIEGIKKNLARGVDVNNEGKYEFTPLHYVARQETSDRYGVQATIEVAAFLLDNGANIHARTDNGDTPLHVAVEYGNKDVALFLVSRGANVSATNCNFDTPLAMTRFHCCIEEQYSCALKEAGARYESEQSKKQLLEGLDQQFIAAQHEERPARQRRM